MFFFICIRRSLRVPRSKTVQPFNRKQFLRPRETVCVYLFSIARKNVTARQNDVGS